MKPTASFGSTIGPVIARYLALKKALGRRCDALQFILTRFDRFLCCCQESDLTPVTFSAWCSSIEHLSPSNRRQEMRAIYYFCLFRRRTEPTCFVPDPSQFPPSQPRPRPYIFTTVDIERLLLATDSLESAGPSPLYPYVARLAVALLYTTGLRRGELVRLTLGDYDAATQTLHIRNSKFHKSRIVPLSADAASEIDRYLKRRRQPGFPCGADAQLLLHHHGALTGYSGPGFGLLMRNLFRKVGISNSSGRSPRVHDLRFTFAAHALLRWYRAGTDVQSRLPALSAYMGHGSIVSTQYYLTFIDAIAEAAAQRFHEHCAPVLFPVPSIVGGGQ